jgi:hypothetical protein
MENVNHRIFSVKRDFKIEKETIISNDLNSKSEIKNNPFISNSATQHEYIKNEKTVDKSADFTSDTENGKKTVKNPVSSTQQEDLNLHKIVINKKQKSDTKYPISNDSNSKSEIKNNPYISDSATQHEYIKNEKTVDKSADFTSDTENGKKTVKNPVSSTQQEDLNLHKIVINKKQKADTKYPTESELAMNRLDNIIVKEHFKTEKETTISNELNSKNPAISDSATQQEYLKEERTVQKSTDSNSVIGNSPVMQLATNKQQVLKSETAVEKLVKERPQEYFNIDKEKTTVGKANDLNSESDIKNNAARNKAGSIKEYLINEKPIDQFNQLNSQPQIDNNTVMNNTAPDSNNIRLNKESI